MAKENTVLEQAVETVEVERKLTFKEQTLLDLSIMDEFDKKFEATVSNTIVTLEEALKQLEVDTTADSKRVTAHKNQVARKVRNIIARAIKSLVETLPEDMEVSE